MASDTPKTFVQQSDLNNNGVLDNPKEVDHLERALKQRLAAMSESEKLKVIGAFTKAFPAMCDTDGLSDKPDIKFEGVLISQKTLQRVVNAIRDGVKGDGTEAAPVKQQALSEPLTPERTPKGSDSLTAGSPAQTQPSR